jgi:hypothetical protein
MNLLKRPNEFHFGTKGVLFSCAWIQAYGTKRRLAVAKVGANVH